MSRQLLTPSPSPPPPMPTPTLPSQINAATKKQHTTLNGLIMKRLPLALPPNASDPRLLGQGLAPFAAIYVIFENCWRQLNDAVEADEKSLTGTHDAQVRRWLSTLRPTGLVRSRRFKDDLDFISARVGTNVNELTLSQRRIIRDMAEELKGKPHLLLAYGWVMYMAIFSGGRWIRQQLSDAGVEFWTGDSSIEIDKSEIHLFKLPGFSFLSFDGEDDGESIKALFKARLAEAETLLTQQERQEIVDAAQQLFSRCIELIKWIDFDVWCDSAWGIVPVVFIFAVAILAILFDWCNKLS